MNGSIKKPGKRKLSGHENELEEYFAELEAGELGSDELSPSNKGRTGLSEGEEIRRLTAYVAHLREKVCEIQQLQPQSSKALPAHSIGAIAGFTVMVGAAAAMGMIARRLSRFC